MVTRTDEQIRAEVARSYGDRVRPVLEADELSLPMVSAGGCCTPTAAEASCCAPAVDESSTSCCGSSAGDDVQISRIAELYSGAPIADLPATVTDVAFGCGNPTAISALREGETVLDLGSGGGIDCFLAAKMVGETGRVIGVDMTPEMIDLANRNREKVGATNVEFRHGQIEALPVESNSVDVIISNCVINLSGDKDRVLKEAFRVLKPGGRLAVSDVVVRGEVPAAIRRSMELWVGCIAGALSEDEYRSRLANAGFANVDVEVTRVYDVDDAKAFLAGEGVDADAIAKEVDGRIVSAFVRATKPASSPCCAPGCCRP